MGEYGWRVLVVDLDYQSSISQLLLSGSEMDELIGSRRLVHEALGECAAGQAGFRRAVCRASKLSDFEIFLVAAGEELGHFEKALSHRWPGEITIHDIPYRLRTNFHFVENPERIC